MQVRCLKPSAHRLLPILGLMGAIGCVSSSVPMEEPLFVHHGIVLSQPVHVEEPLEPLGSRWLLRRDWTPGALSTIDGREHLAPMAPECVIAYEHPLGAPTVSLGGSEPDTALAFSPDSRYLAVGTALGELLVLRASSGQVVARRSVTEGLVKQLSWSANSETLYVGEQSPDAMLWAFSTDLAVKWTLRLADRLGSSPLPASSDLFGIYTLPGVFGIDPLADGSLLVTGVHAWNTDAGRVNRSVLLHLNASGAVIAEWPAEKDRSITLMPPAIEGEVLAIRVGRSATDVPPPSLPIDGVQLLSLPDLLPLKTYQPKPLKPWFDKAFVWEGLDLSARQLLLGLSDGRALLWERGADRVKRLDIGTPIVAGDVPIYASIGRAEFSSTGPVILTSNTNIPYGSASPELRPPHAHPAENTLWSYNTHGELLWRWHGPHVLNGMTLGSDRIIIGTGPRISDERTDLYGLLVLNSDGEQAGELRSVCETKGPIFFRQAISETGLMAVAEVPWVDSKGLRRGRYQLTVFR